MYPRAVCISLFSRQTVPGADSSLEQMCGRANSTPASIHVQEPAESADMEQEVSAAQATPVSSIVPVPAGLPMAWPTLRVAELDEDCCRSRWRQRCATSRWKMFADHWASQYRHWCALPCMRLGAPANWLRNREAGGRPRRPIERGRFLAAPSRAGLRVLHRFRRLGRGLASQEHAALYASSSSFSALAQG
jgi:hypothetical protein